MIYDLGQKLGSFLGKAVAPVTALGSTIKHDLTTRPMTLSEQLAAHAQEQVESLFVADNASPYQGDPMAFGFASIGHALASGLHDVYKGLVAVENFVAKASTPGNQATIEGLTSLIPGFGSQAAMYERAVFAVAGQTAAILTKVTDGGEQKLLDAGFDAQIIADFKALIAATPGLIAGAVPAVKG